MLEIYTYNAGKGDCIRVHFADTHNIFIDSGVRQFGLLFRQICREITKSGENLDALILTHVDDDHIGGILDSLRLDTYKCPFQEVWMNHSGNPYIGDRMLSVHQNDETYAYLKKQGITVRNMYKGDCRNIAGAVIETYWPAEETISARFPQDHNVPLSYRRDYHFSLDELAKRPLPVHDSSYNNKQSIICSIAFDKHKLLFTGDAWADDVVTAKGVYDLIKLPHHGSARNISDAYKENLSSSNFLICTDGINHPDKQTIAKLEQWYGEINVFSPANWWKQEYFRDGDKNHRINYIKKEGLVIKW